MRIKSIKHPRKILFTSLFALLYLLELASATYNKPKINTDLNKIGV